MKNDCVDAWTGADLALKVRKKAGTENYDLQMEASSNRAVIQGMGALVVTFAEETGLSIGSVLGWILSELTQQVKESEAGGCGEKEQNNDPGAEGSPSAEGV